RRADQPVDTPPAMTRSSAPTSVELVLAHQRMAAAGETPVQTQKSKTDDPRMSEADLAPGDLSKSRPKAQAQPTEQPVTAVRAPAVMPSESIWATAVTEPGSVTVDASISSAAADDAVVAPVAAAQSDAPAVQQSVLAQSAAGRADVARHVAQQLAASIQVLQDGNLEIALNPEELGRVKIAISMQDAGVMITIQTDRGETMDLMRRNISMLEQAFRDMGHGSVDFSFQSDQQANADDQGSGSESNGLLDGLPQEMDPVERALALPGLSGLDIRV
ncbi:MAG: flagellar hook-length control protein FliK, partial [Pseudomonadota bacterium]